MSYTISKSKMILRRLGGGDEAYNLKVTRCTYVEEADNDANKDSALISCAFPSGERIIK